MSKLYRITCFRTDGSERFEGYLITRADDVFEGIIRQNDHTTFIIKGVDVKNFEGLAFLKVSCVDKNVIPKLFLFDCKEKGYCSKHNLYYGFNKWEKGWSCELEELEDDTLMRKVYTKFKHRCLTLSELGKSLIDQYEHVREFF